MDLIEGLVADSTASSLQSWIGFAVDLHKALHSSSPGSNRKDAPTRLLEWMDAGVVHQKNGAFGLLRYSAILASGGDAHLSSGIVLVSDSMDVEIVVVDSNNTLDGQVIDNLLEVTAVASSLFEEGAITVICIVLMNFKSTIERLSNSSDVVNDVGGGWSWLSYGSGADVVVPPFGPCCCCLCWLFPDFPRRGREACAASALTRPVSTLAQPSPTRCPSSLNPSSVMSAFQFGLFPFTVLVDAWLLHMYDGGGTWVAICLCVRGMMAVMVVFRL